MSCVLVFALSMVACSPGSDSDDASATRDPSAQLPVGVDEVAIALNNRGVGLMGRFDYAAAHQVFSDLVGLHPEWSQARVNLAIATLNRQQEGDEQAALAMVDALIADEPGNLAADYVAGLLRLYLASPELALEHFRRVARADPGDAYAAYYLAQSLSQGGEHQQALKQYQRAIELDPYLRSAYYGAFQALRRIGQRERARELVTDYQRLAKNPRARLAEFKYSRMGPKAEARAFDPPGAPAPPAAVERPTGGLFAPIVSIDEGLGLPRSRPGLSRGDLGGGAGVLLLLTGVGDEAAPNRVYRLGLDGVPKALAGHPLAAVADVNSALWGDYDNDGLTDVYLLRRGPNQLWRQHVAGEWRDVSAETDTAGGDINSVDGLFMDLDHDGDLDLFVANRAAPDELFNNDRNGSFRPIAAAQGVAGDADARQVLAADLDGDRDLDLVVRNQRPPHRVFRNDRLWRYEDAPGFEAFTASRPDAVVAVDIDADGVTELYTVGPAAQLRRWSPDQQGVWRQRVLTTIEALAGERVQLEVADIDGDGVPDLIAGSRIGWTVLSVAGDSVKALDTRYEALEHWRSLALMPSRGASMMALMSSGQLRLWPPGKGRHPFLALALSGMEDAGQSMRSNASGLGASIALRRGRHWTRTMTPVSGSAAGQDLAPAMIGLGGADKADFVSIDWSDGVFQSELDVAASVADEATGTDGVAPISETQRQLSSCPVLYAWDGERYRFVSDLLGVGGIGYAVGPGEYAQPRPWENYLFKRVQPQPRDGRYQLKIGEPMEEVAYLDAARLVAYDLPPGWGMVLDERMAINAPHPTGEPRFFRRELLPHTVTAGDGAQLTGTVLQADARAAPVGELDRRFIGRLAAEQQLILDFEQALDGLDGQPLLMIDGWVEYPYSQTQFAAWQAGAGFHAPTVEALGADGEWHLLLAEFGYPAGMPRRMSVPLPALPKGTRSLRLRTNMEVYFDRIAVVYAEVPPAFERRQLRLAQARLARVGFPLRSTAAQRFPDYDYAQRAPFWDVNYQRGWYTRPGAVDELVAASDDALALIGPGDEVHLEFDAPVEPPATGWSRHLVLETNGWAKDRDLFTRDGETVAPLPSSGEASKAAEQLHARYNTRFQDGR